MGNDEKPDLPGLVELAYLFPIGAVSGSGGGRRREIESRQLNLPRIG